MKRTYFNKRKTKKRIQSFLKFSHTFPGEILKILSVILIVLLFNQGIAKATEEDTKKGGDEFSVIGTVVRITDSEMHLEDARGTKKNLDSYSINIEHVEKVVTKESMPFLLSNIRPGNVVVVDGVIEGEKYFAQKIAYFSNIPLTNKSFVHNDIGTVSNQEFEEQKYQYHDIQNRTKTMDTFGNIAESTIKETTNLILKYVPNSVVK